MAGRDDSPLGDGMDDIGAEEPVDVEELGVELLLGARSNDTHACARLLEKGAALYAREERSGWDALTWAASHGNVEVLSLLLEHGAAQEYIDARRRRGLAVGERGRDPAAGGVTGLTVSVGDSTEGDAGEVGWRNSVPCPTPLHQAAFKGHLRVVWRLLLAGFAVDDVDNSGNTPLHLACAGGHLAVVRCLMTQGFDMEALNWVGVGLLQLATDPGVRALLLRARDQTHCAASGVEFAYPVLRFMCEATGAFFSRHFSVAEVVLVQEGRGGAGSQDEEDGEVRPTRYSRSALEALRAAEAAVGEAVSEAELGGEGEADGEADAPITKGAAAAAATSLPVAVAELRKSLTGWEARAEAISQTVREAESRGVAGGMLEQGRAEAARVRCAGLMAAEMEDLQRRRPLSRRALMQPLLKRLEEARKVGVQRRMLDLATTLVRSCQAEQSVVAQLTLCKRIPTAAPSHDRDVARLLEAAAVLRRLDAQSPVLAEAVLLGRRMRAEIDLQLAMQAPVVREDGTYALVWAPAGASSSAEGGLRGHPTVVGNQLLALRARVPRLAKVMEAAEGVEGVSDTLRHMAADSLKDLKKKLAEAEAMEAERLRLEEEERLKREKKKKKKKKPKK